MEFVTTSKRRRAFTSDGFLYYFQRQNKDGSTIFYCAERTSTKCPGMIKLNADGTTNSQKEHRHLKVDEKILQLNFQNELRTEAETTDKSVNEIVREKIVELTDYDATILHKKKQ
ncbi:hypothetical protein SNEBB_006211 [Seison nebaliae]|nr:hypothetical protein SNEBB_006211 [Seison nebaliae]